ncbi:hypothetical protein [Vibrio nereis]|uniref:Uncharacterized protein n=1 Tax=Vibrio nereis TaxID=693 RepID=A0A0M0HRR9_VIBNE|nr:hypothetical protein [Vibrio nereis]KOO04582.1 hypothetical protein AKJ17_06655 [Vibrio nereis]
MDDNDKDELIKQLSMFVGCEMPTKPNSWERVEEIREELLTDTDNYPWRAEVEELWEQLSRAQNDELMKIDRQDRCAETPLEALFSGVEIPRYQPMEVLASVKEAFDIYMLAQGKLTLEDVFFGPMKKGVGNYAARRSKKSTYGDFDFYARGGGLFMTVEERDAHENMSLESKAIEYLAYGMNPEIAKIYNKAPDYHNIPDPESYLRGYRRWKRTNK